MIEHTTVSTKGPIVLSSFIGSKVSCVVMYTDTAAVSWTSGVARGARGGKRVWKMSVVIESL